MEEKRKQSFHKYVLKLGEESKNIKGVISTYNEWSEDYDNDLHFQEFNAHESIADLFLSKVGNDIMTKCKVLDICAGTGWVGEYLRHRGFKGQIDAQDGSSKMLEVAKTKEGVYSQFFCHIIEPDTSMPPELSKGNYDVVIASGCFWPGWVNALSLKHFVNAVRVGGLLFFELRRLISKDIFDFNMEVEKEIFRLESLGVLKLVDLKFNPKYRKEGDGGIGLIPGGNVDYCFKKLAEYSD